MHWRLKYSLGGAFTSGAHVALAFPAFVRSPEKSRRPTAVGFEKRDPQCGMARQHTAGAKAAEREHLLQRLRVDAAQHEIWLEALADCRRPVPVDS